MSTPPRSSPPKKIRPHRFDAHHRFLLAAAAGLIVLVALHGHATVATQAVASWDGFALVTIVVAWLAMARSDPYEARRNAALQDESRTFLFVLVVFAATISLFAVFILLHSVKNLPPANFAVHLGLSVVAIAESWFMVHTLFGIRYAHFYYLDARKLKRENIDGGLIFPDQRAPDYLDFAYFSFIIGMTCQVSDVQISSTSIRRLALIHGLISFAFNTAILAVFVNIIAGLI